jgi:hypothetical protein
VGKGEAGVNGHSLPVVAVGSIPHIYRRAGLAPGDPNRSCPVTRNHAACLTMLIAVLAKRFQGQQPNLATEVWAVPRITGLRLTMVIRSKSRWQSVTARTLALNFCADVSRWRGERDER